MKTNKLWIILFSVMGLFLAGCEQQYDLATFANGENVDGTQISDLNADEPGGHGRGGSGGPSNPSDPSDLPDGALDEEITPVIPDSPSNPADLRCGNTGKHIMICHLPSGNPAARQTKCISINGAVNGHGLSLADRAAVGGHGGDFLGACSR